MAVEIPIVPSTAVRQKDDSLSLAESGAQGFVASFIDNYETLETFARSLKSGIAVRLVANGDDLILKTYQLRRTAGGLGLLSLSYAEPDTTTSQQATIQTPLDELWEIKSVRNDISVLAYCGKLSDNAANRAFIEAWQREPDASLAMGYSYRREDGTIAYVEELGGAKAATCGVIDKLLQGKESVMRFYPMLVCTKTYSQPPDNLQVNSGYIDTPAPSGNARSPGLSNFISAHTWVMGPDECVQQPDKTWKRVTTWLGIRNDSVKSPETPWDTDFYGPDGTRWKIPYTASVS